MWAKMFLSVFYSLLAVTYAYPSGAPCAVLDTLTPQSPHYPKARGTEPPFSINVLDASNRPTCSYTAGSEYYIEIRGTTEAKGFILQALQIDSATSEPAKGKRVGQFIDDGSWDGIGIQYQKCPGVDKDSITHTIQLVDAPTKLLRFKWKAPADNKGSAAFLVTVVNKTYLYWTNIRSVTLAQDSNAECPSPAACQLSEWTPWGSCVNGKSNRIRTVTQKSANGGTACLPPDLLKEEKLCGAAQGSCSNVEDKYPGQCSSSLREYQGNKDFCCWYGSDNCKKTCCDKVCS